MLAPEPLGQFESWLEQAVKAGLEDPTAMVLATVDERGAPTQRIVLLKGLSRGGFVFYTNYSSAKARDMEHNPEASLLFPWNELDRLVIIGGRVEKMSVAESAGYFATRPRDSQIAAWASRQSRPVSKRALLVEEFRAMREKFGRGEIPLPDFWGGYRVIPRRIEFWQGGENRLHDRFVYSLAGENGWNIEQLQP
jgi:pyridoxamine 5'-phosphate oxidase